MTPYILIAGNAETVSGLKVAARDIARRRVEARRWCLYKKTPHKGDLRVGDQVLVYAAGKGAGEFLATTTLKRTHTDDLQSPDGPDVSTKRAALALDLGPVEWFLRPVRLVDIRDRLEFMPPAPAKWGHLLQRGIKRISTKDYETIAAAARSTAVPSR